MPCGGCGKKAKATRRRKAMPKADNVRKTNYNNTTKEYLKGLRKKNQS